MRSNRELTLPPSEQAANTEFGHRQQAESARKRAAEMRVQQQIDAMPRMVTTAEAEARMRRLTGAQANAAPEISRDAHQQHECPGMVPKSNPRAVADAKRVAASTADPRQRADAAADTAAETAAKAVIRSGARVPGLGEMCERIAQEKQVLGTGAFSAVFRGTISGLGEVAVKRLERQAGDDDVADFQREVAILQLPEHPNLLRMLGCGASRNARYLVYPFIGGGDLLSYLGSAHPTVREHGCRLGIAQDVVAGLRALHGHSPAVLHRDLKPQNVLIRMDHRTEAIGEGGPDVRPRALLSDFGLARFAPELRAATHLTSGHMVGTFGYQAPEIMLGQYSTASDVYSLGVLLLQCATGRNAIAPGKEGGKPRHLSAWAREARARKDDGLADPRADFPWRVAESLVSVGLDCCASAAAARPSLDAVSSRLGGLGRA